MIEHYAESHVWHPAWAAISTSRPHLEDLLPVQVRCGHCQDVGTVAYHSVDEVFVCAMRSQQPGFFFDPLPEIED